MQFPERHPELALYFRLGIVVILLGAVFIGVGLLAGRYVSPHAPSANLGPLDIAWWERFGWGNGIALMVLGVSLLVFGALKKRSILFGDRIRREYK